MATAVAPLSPRAREGATVSMPLNWPQVVRSLDPKRYTLRTAPALLVRSKPWEQYREAARPLQPRDTAPHYRGSCQRRPSAPSEYDGNARAIARVVRPPAWQARLQTTPRLSEDLFGGRDAFDHSWRTLTVRSKNPEGHNSIH